MAMLGIYMLNFKGVKIINSRRISAISLVSISGFVQAIYPPPQKKKSSLSCRLIQGYFCLKRCWIGPCCLQFLRLQNRSNSNKKCFGVILRVFLLIKMMPFRESHNLFAAPKKQNTSQNVKLIQIMFLSHFNGNETHLFFIKYFITAMRKQIPNLQRNQTSCTPDTRLACC